jgi:hypothetical protein
VKRFALIRPTGDGRWRVTLAGVVSTLVEQKSDALALVPSGWAVDMAEEQGIGNSGPARS